MERYRSGHNEAVLKTVCPKGRVGSNPTLSAQTFQTIFNGCSYLLLIQAWYFGEVLKWLKRHPWKGCRSLIAARGFKSLLLRSLKIKDIFLLTRDFFSDNITKLPKKTVARNGSLITEQQCNPEKIPNLKVLSEGFKGRTIQRTKPRNSKVSESQLKLA